MKPFNLEKALAGEPVVTKQGDKVIQLHYFPNLGSEFKVIAHREHSFTFDTYKIDGSYGNKQSEIDLMMSEPEQWVNVYWNFKDGIYGSPTKQFYQSKQKALDGIEPHEEYQTTIKLK
jgi:hypothetical protein